MSILGIIALILFIVAIVVAAKNGEFRAGTAWFLTLFGLAACASLGAFGFIGLG